MVTRMFDSFITDGGTETAPLVRPVTVACRSSCRRTAAQWSVLFLLQATNEIQRLSLACLVRTQPPRHQETNTQTYAAALLHERMHLARRCKPSQRKPRLDKHICLQARVLPFPNQVTSPLPLKLLLYETS